MIPPLCLFSLITTFSEFSNLSSLSFGNAQLLLFFVSLEDLSGFSITRSIEQLRGEFKLLIFSFLPHRLQLVIDSPLYKCYLLAFLCQQDSGEDCFC